MDRTKKCMLFIACVFRMCLMPKEKCALQKCTRFLNGPPSFLDCFLLYTRLFCGLNALSTNYLCNLRLLPFIFSKVQSSFPRKRLSCTHGLAPSPRTARVNPQHLLQQLPVLLRSIASNTFLRSLVLFPHTFSDYLSLLQTTCSSRIRLSLLSLPLRTNPCRGLPRVEKRQSGCCSTVILVVIHL